MNYKLKNILITSLMISLNIITIILCFILVYPFKVIEISKVEVLTPKVKVGTQARFRITGCKYIAVPAKAQRKLINHYEYFLTEETTNDLTKGCFVKEMSMPIPSYVDVGVYHIHNDLIHKVFGFREIATHWESPEFDIVK